MGQHLTLQPHTRHHSGIQVRLQVRIRGYLLSKHENKEVFAYRYD